MLNVGISSLPKGSYFGEIPMMLKLLSSFVYRTGAKEETLLFSIKTERLSEILDEFPGERDVLVKRALKRRQYFKHIRELKKLLLFKRYLKRLASLGVAERALISSRPSTMRVSNPSPPTFTQSESDERDFERRIPTSESP